MKNDPTSRIQDLRQFGEFGGMLTIDFGNHEIANRVMQLMQEKDTGYLAVNLCYFKTPLSFGL